MFLGMLWLSACTRVGRNSSSTSIASESSGSNEGLIAFLRDGRLCAHDMTTNKQFGLPVSNPCENPCWSPDGTKLAYIAQCKSVATEEDETTKGYLAFFDLRVNKEAKTNIQLTGDSGIVWMPDNERVVITGWDAARAVSATTLKVTQDISSGQFDNLMLLGGNSHPTTGEIAFLWLDKDKQVYGIAIGDRALSNWRRLRLGKYLGSGILTGPPEWHPKDRRLAVPSLDDSAGSRICILSEGSGQRPSKNYIENATDGSWSPDGTFFAYTDSTDKIRIVNDTTRKETIIARLPQNTSAVTFTWAPDSRRVVVDILPGGKETLPDSASADVYMIEAETGQARRLLTRALSPVWQPTAFAYKIVKPVLPVSGQSPQFQTMKAPDGSIQLFRRYAKGWQQVTFLRGTCYADIKPNDPKEKITTFSVSPNGKWIALEWHGQELPLKRISQVFLYETSTHLVYLIAGQVAAAIFEEASHPSWRGTVLSYNLVEPERKRTSTETIDLAKGIPKFITPTTESVVMRAALQYLKGDIARITNIYISTGEPSIALRQGDTEFLLVVNRKGSILRRVERPEDC